MLLLKLNQMSFYFVDSIVFLTDYSTNLGVAKKGWGRADCGDSGHYRSTCRVPTVHCKHCDRDNHATKACNSK